MKPDAPFIMETDYRQHQASRSLTAPLGEVNLKRITDITLTIHLASNSLIFGSEAEDNPQPDTCWPICYLWGPRAKQSSCKIQIGEWDIVIAMCCPTALERSRLGRACQRLVEFETVKIEILCDNYSEESGDEDAWLQVPDYDPVLKGLRTELEPLLGPSKFEWTPGLYAAYRESICFSPQAFHAQKTANGTQTG